MSNPQASYASPKLEARHYPEKGGWGVYAREWIRAGELLIVWAGEVVPGEQLVRLSAIERRYTVQVEEDLYLVTVRDPEPADLINHSCNPNAGLSGQIALTAMRDIAPGEEVCFDYAMTDGSPYDEFPCACGAPNCQALAEDMVNNKAKMSDCIFLQQMWVDEGRINARKAFLNIQKKWGTDRFKADCNKRGRRNEGF